MGDKEDNYEEKYLKKIKWQKIKLLHEINKLSHKINKLLHLSNKQHLAKIDNSV